MIFFSSKLSLRSDALGKEKKLDIDSDLKLSAGELLWIIGDDQSGKDLFIKTISDTTWRQANLRNPQSFTLNPSYQPRDDQESIQIISRQEQERLWQEEDYHDDSEFQIEQDKGRSLRTYLNEFSSNEVTIKDCLKKLNLKSCQDTGLRYLSTGEFRRSLMARSLLSCSTDKPRLIIIDDLYEGVDSAGRQSINNSLSTITCQIAANTSQGIVICTDDFNMPEQVKTSLTNKILVLNAGQEIFLGSYNEFCSKKQSLIEEIQKTKKQRFSKTPTVPDSFPTPPIDPSLPLVHLRSVNISYDDKKILDQASIKIKLGETWLIQGPNGCGKTSLISMMTGECPQSFREDVHLFGKKRGSGESLQEIRQKIGYISSSLHLKYDRPMKAPLVIISGLHDSIGIYKKPNQDELSCAMQWLECLGMSDFADHYFDELNFAQQRLLLLARAMIKEPPLLILDEPCQGLDRDDSLAYTSFLEKLFPRPDMSLVLVCHDEDFIPKLNFQKFISSSPGKFQ